MADFCNNKEDFSFRTDENDFVRIQFKPRIGEKWREIQGEERWKGLLEPIINPVLQTELLRYGDFAQLCYDSFDDKTYSRHYASCKHSKETLFQKMGMPNCGYRVTKYLYANTAVLGCLFGHKKREYVTGGGRHAWIGFVAVCTDEDEIRRLGRRDILIAWRGTQTPQEWIHDLTDILVPARLSRGTSATTKRDHGVRIEKGFLTCYASSMGSSDGLSARETVLKEIRRLVEEYQEDQEGLSITLTGHSLGGALATLSAYDIAKQLGLANLRRPSPVTVTVFAFASPRVGNPEFAQQLENVGVKVLRVVNKQDVVPRVPGIFINENLGSTIPRLFNWLPWTYVHVGVQLTLDTNTSPFLKKHRIFWPADLGHFHNLEVYLHLLDGFVGRDKPYKSNGRDPALVNKSSDLLIARLHIPSHWLQEQNKGLVKNVHSRWTLRSLSYSLSVD